MNLTGTLDKQRLADLTLRYGGNWGLDHSRRILHLVSILGEGVDYDADVIAVAAYLHDWGGYTEFAQQGVDHAVRSTEVAREFLADTGLPDDEAALVLECIENHHGGDPGRSIESRLFTDADALDLLGIVGTLRIFAMWPRDIRAGHAATKRWRETCLKAISLEQTKPIADQRVAETDHLLRMFEQETFGIF